MGRVVHFEIHADDPDRAVRFYEAALGWTFSRWGDEPYWLVATGPDNEPGINGGLIKRRGAVDGEAVIAFVCTVDVDSVDETSKAVTENGGAIVVPKTAVPNVGWLVHCKDTEGNVFGLMQADPQAR